MRQREMTLIRIAAVLWIVWGVVHAFAGVMTIRFAGGGSIAEAIGGIADAVDAATVAGNYPEALGGILGQHGFNLLWFGIATTVGALFMWRASRIAVAFNAIVGGLADVGYFIFIDLAGYANFVPGTVMTIVSATAILLSVIVVMRGRRG